MIDLMEYGWDGFFNTEWMKICGPADVGPVNRRLAPGQMLPARVLADYGQKLLVITEAGELTVSRPVHKYGDEAMIAVGDWLALEKEQAGWDEKGRDQTGWDEKGRDQEGCGREGRDYVSGDWVIRSVLPRKTKFSRAAAGIELKEQIVAANMDTVFLMQSLNRDFNIRRLERYLIAAWESGAVPVVVLTKMDVCEDVAGILEQVYKIAPGVDVHAVSSVTGEGVEGIKKYLGKGRTVALLGSSGVGKSTLVNLLAGRKVLETREIREDDSKGRHTTTHREIVLLPGGGMVMDTPGMRTMSLWEADNGMELMFGDIEELTAACRFHDCGHRNEPGCAVREALETGRLDAKRWEAWLKLQKELAHLEAKKEGKLRLQEKQWGRQLSKFQKEFYNSSV